jgi:serine phosphatase RsbU (regulator of sigma subunit)
MKKKILFCYFLLLAVLLSAQNKIILNKLQLDSTKSIALDKFWKFHNGDDSTWKALSFDDSKWDTVNTLVKFDKNDSTVFKGIAWFRIHLFIDSSLNNTPLCLLVNQGGASQLFLDGKLIHSLGVVSRNSSNEKKYNPWQIPLSFQYQKAGEHLLVVRYSNLDYRDFFKKYDITDPGFKLNIAKLDLKILESFNQNNDNAFLLTGLALFFFTLSFVHLLFFLFYKKQRSNLYYSIFVGLLGTLFIIPEMVNNSFDPALSIKLDNSYQYLIPLFFYSMLVLEYSIFKRKATYYFWISTLALIVLFFIESYTNDTFSTISLFSFIISTVVASFFVVIKSILKKTDGAWIIGTGSLIFLLALGIIIVRVLFFGGNFQVHSLFLVTLLFFALISIPVSMSIYLARDFAKTSKTLGAKLIEVEALSEKAIEQEKEKQKILETQKEVLEVQVKQRISEIVEQKTVIEKKNKDITDSINYAKTIQDAILPAKEIKYNLFPNSFILFKPKDIVSGDFYWFTEKENKKLIAVCDCTGHGVPGALMSMIGNNIINHIVNEKEITIPGEILNQLHKEIRQTLKQAEQNDTRDGMDAAFITFSTETEITFSGAQRPLWIIRKIDIGALTTDNAISQQPITNYQLIEIKGDKYAIGGLQSETERKFTNHKVTLCKNDSVYIFSDGFADQFSDVDKKLMTSRFKELLLSIQQKSMPEQELFLNDFIENWRGTREQIDDILVIGIKI